MNNTKDAHKLKKKKTQEMNRVPKRKGSGQSGDNPRFHCTTLIGNRENP